VAKARHALIDAGRQTDAEMLDSFTWHCLRHTFACRLAMAGVDLLAIKDLGGCRTLAMVTRSHLTPGRLREGVERLVTPAASGQNLVSTDTVSDTSTQAVEAVTR
jgi:site-specific recombinase XerD